MSKDKGEKKTWYSVEAAGVSVRVYLRPGSARYQFFYMEDGERIRGLLKTTNLKLAKERALAIARVVATRRLTGVRPDTVTLGQVFAVYFQLKAPQFTESWRRASQTRRALFEKAWGTDKKIRDIGQSDLDRFSHLRRSGDLIPDRPNSNRAGVRDGTIAADFRWLSCVFRWAKGHKVDGQPLVQSNPLEGLKRPKEKKENIRRSIASPARYLATLAEADDVDPAGRLKCMLSIARFSGRRENAICNLRVSDLLLSADAVLAALAGHGRDENRAPFYPFGGIAWRGETDKQGVDRISPISQRCRIAIDEYLTKSPRIGDVPLFPSPTDPTKPIRKDLAGNWLVRAEQLAGQPKLENGRWHPYRRLWATERKDLPLADVARAGGWSDTQVLQDLYQLPDAETVLRVVEAGG